MKYCQLDRIVSLKPGEEIVAERTLRADEEFLVDHFPRFPVMPGVMMLESLHQAAMWLVYAGDHFQHPVVMLRTVKSVKFGDFLSPGQTLRITATVLKTTQEGVSVKAVATKDDKTTVSARLLLQPILTGDDPSIGTDPAVCKAVKDQFRTLFPSQAEFC